MWALVPLYLPTEVALILIFTNDERPKGKRCCGADKDPAITLLFQATTSTKSFPRHGYE